MRMKAYDSIFQNRSTFMVEMTESSDILSRATPRSLVVLDELGRGSSTQEGEGLAFAVLSELTHRLKCVTLFTTHFFSLARQSFPETQVFQFEILEGMRDGIANVDFLYKLKPGCAGKSHG